MNDLINEFKERHVKAKNVFNFKVISKRDAYNFIRQYHYLGDAKFFSEFNVGMYINDDIVGCATFSRPQGISALKSWFGIEDNSYPYIKDLSRLCVIPSLNGTNATSYLLGNSLKMLKKNGDKAVITLADSSKHCGSIYQVCNFKYYGLSSKRSDFWVSDENGNCKTYGRGKTKHLNGVWLPRTRKHRYCYILSDDIECILDEVVPYPSKDEIIPTQCCNGEKIVFDNRHKIAYTCPKCTGVLKRVNE